jgi:hypothetical protein
MIVWIVPLRMPFKINSYLPTYLAVYWEERLCMSYVCAVVVCG